ncbi:hypothetical protein K438DRAFT_882760 [Mycena galopus ATCC 62051]|nr:hypothetical protein K438DRAFT_882760 [Mycena galopus ATCC 62051]
MKARWKLRFRKICWSLMMAGRRRTQTPRIVGIGVFSSGVPTCIPIRDPSITYDEGTSILENGWIRCAFPFPCLPGNNQTSVNSACIAEEYRHWVYFDDVYSQGWLAQACHIFNSLDIKSNLEDYVLVERIWSCLHLLGPIENLPPGYLFLCPLAEFETDLPGCFVIPDCTAYWSVDPLGAERLSAEEARTLGLPEIHSWMEVWVKYWDSSDYDGIHQFHEAKGFDPYSQDVAIELGYPLFQVSCQQDDLFAHSCEVNTDEDYSESEGGSVGEDHGSPLMPVLRTRLM